VQIVLLIAGLLLLVAGVSIVVLETGARRSGVPIGRVGDPIRVVLHPESPERVTIESPITYVIGVVLALFGVVSCAIFFVTFRWDTFSVITSLVVAAYAGVRLHTLRARSQGAITSWRKIRESILSRTINLEARAQIPWADEGALAAAARRRERVNRFAWPLLVAAGAGLLFLAAHMHRTTSAFLARAVPGSGRVVDLAASESSDDDTTYAAVVEFEADGEPRRFKDSLGANPPLYRPGDQVPVLYLPDDPGVARIDRGIWSRALPPLVGALGALLAVAGTWMGARGLSPRT